MSKQPDIPMPAIHRKYAPLENLRTRYAIITGGRGSGKSFAIATRLIAESYNLKGKTILFTRYTLTNAEQSVMPEFLDKIARIGGEKHFQKSGNDIVNLTSGTRILFRGIKTSTGINTAALKSIPNLAIWVNDESEELVDESTFDTIDLSIRDKDSHCQVWLALNPSDVTHFIYRRFYAGNGVQQVCNDVRGDVTYIHTTYKDNAHLPQDYIDKAERMAEEEPQKYAHIWLGQWEQNKEGLVFPQWRPATDTEWPAGLPIWYGLDWGYSPDPTAIVRVAYDPIHATVWLREIVSVNESIPSDVGPLIAEDAAKFGMRPAQCVIYCDSANPAGIAELRRLCSLNAVPADKRDRTYQVSWLHGFTVRYIGEGIGKEVRTYSYLPSKTDRTVFTKVPQDGNDHYIDASRYGIYTHLQRLGVSPRNE